MKSPAPTQAITTADAEIACTRGDAETLSRYLRLTDNPSPDVIQNIAACRLANQSNSGPGPGNWKLILSTRKGGRPAKNRRWPTDAAQAVDAGHAPAAGSYLGANPEIDGATQRALAEALDPVGDSKWKLTFKRPRKGNPRSDLRTAINQALMDQATNTLRARAKAEGSEVNLADSIYPKVQRELERHFPKIKAGKSTVRAARAAIKRAKAKNPPL
jgi:hypothetical protein